MAASGRTLSDLEVASLAEIVAPAVDVDFRIGFGGRDGRFVATAINLRRHKGRRLDGRKANAGEDGAVDIAEWGAHTGAGDKLADRMKSKGFRFRLGPRGHGGRSGCTCRRRIAAREPKRAQEAPRDPLGISAGKPRASLRAIV